MGHPKATEDHIFLRIQDGSFDLTLVDDSERPHLALRNQLINKTYAEIKFHSFVDVRSIARFVRSFNRFGARPLQNPLRIDPELTPN